MADPVFSMWCKLWHSSWHHESTADLSLLNNCRYTSLIVCSSSSVLWNQEQMDLRLPLCQSGFLWYAYQSTVFASHLLCRSRHFRLCFGLVPFPLSLSRYLWIRRSSAYIDVPCVEAPLQPYPYSPFAEQFSLKFHPKFSGWALSQLPCCFVGFFDSLSIIQYNATLLFKNKQKTHVT